MRVSPLLVLKNQDEIYEKILHDLYMGDSNDFLDAISLIRQYMEGLPWIKLNMDIPERLDVVKNEQRIKDFGYRLFYENIRVIIERSTRFDEFYIKRETLLMFKHFKHIINSPKEIIYLLAIIYDILNKIRNNIDLINDDKHLRLFKMATKLSYRYMVNEFIYNTNLMINPYIEKLFKLYHRDPYDEMLHKLLYIYKNIYSKADIVMVNTFNIVPRFNEDNIDDSEFRNEILDMIIVPKDLLDEIYYAYIQNKTKNV